MTFTPKEWKNGSGGGTPLSAGAMIDLETRLIAAGQATKGEAAPGNSLNLGTLYFQTNVESKVIAIWLGQAPSAAIQVADLTGIPADGSVTAAKVAAANVDGAVGIPGFRSLLTKVEADATHAATAKAAQERIERAERLGLPEKYWWGLTFPFQFGAVETLSPENTARYCRFVPPRNMKIRGLSFIVTTIATTNDECAVAVLAADGKTVLGKSAATAGKLNAATGRQDVDFEADVELTAGTVYYVAFQFKKTTGTAAKLMVFNTIANGYASVIGSTIGELLTATGTPTFPFASEITPTVKEVAHALIVRER